MTRNIALISVLIILVFITGCSRDVEVQGNLTPSQSVELLVLFDQAGISAHRELASSGRNQRYTVFVPEGNLKKALLVMYELKLPKQTQENLDEITKSDGLFPVSQQMAVLRYDIARSLMVERQLETFPGVLDAAVSVHSHTVGVSINPVAINDRNVSGVPSASVVVRYVDSGQPIPVARMREIIAQSVDGLSIDDIVIETIPVTSVVFSGSNPASANVELFWPFGFRISQEDFAIAFNQIIGVMLMILVFGCLIGLFVGVLLFQKRKGSNKVVTANQQVDLSMTQKQQTIKRPLRQPTLMLNAREAREISGNVDVE